MSSSKPLLILDSPEQNFKFTAPPLALYSIDGATAQDTSKSVVERVGLTMMWNYDTSAKDVAPSYIQVVFTFNLLSALLDSAPTGTNPNLFLLSVKLPSEVSQTSYIVDAQIQTKGNSAMSPTYITSTSGYTESGTTFQTIIFPVTNFFNVSSPGAPYTITLTLQKVKIV